MSEEEKESAEIEFIELGSEIDSKEYSEKASLSIDVIWFPNIKTLICEEGKRDLKLFLT